MYQRYNSNLRFYLSYYPNEVRYPTTQLIDTKNLIILLKLFISTYLHVMITAVDSINTNSSSSNHSHAFPTLHAKRAQFTSRSSNSIREDQGKLYFLYIVFIYLAGMFVHSVIPAGKQAQPVPGVKTPLANTASGDQLLPGTPIEDDIGGTQWASYYDDTYVSHINRMYMVSCYPPSTFVHSVVLRGCVMFFVCIYTRNLLEGHAQIYASHLHSFHTSIHRIRLVRPRSYGMYLGSGEIAAIDETFKPP
jgi:hypothetical protein